MLATKVHEVFTITKKALLGNGIPNSNLLIVVVVMHGLNRFLNVLSVIEKTSRSFVYSSSRNASNLESRDGLLVLGDLYRGVAEDLARDWREDLSKQNFDYHCYHQHHSVQRCEHFRV